MIDNKNEKYFSNTLKKAIDDKLIGRGVTELSEVTQEQLYQATVLVLKDIMKEKRPWQKPILPMLYGLRG